MPRLSSHEWSQQEHKTIPHKMQTLLECHPCWSWYTVTTSFCFHSCSIFQCSVYAELNVTIYRNKELIKKHFTKSIQNLTVSFRLSVWLFYRGQCLYILYGYEILFEKVWMFGYVWIGGQMGRWPIIDQNTWCFLIFTSRSLLGIWLRKIGYGNVIASVLLVLRMKKTNIWAFSENFKITIIRANEFA